MRHLIQGGREGPLLPEIRAAIHQATSIEMAVSFIKSSGLSLIYDALAEAVERPDTRISILTSDYLGITDPQALRDLSLLVDRGADVRVFRAIADQSFHMKAYIFTQGPPAHPTRGTAFIGSSNISKSALTEGLEWNYRIDAAHSPSDLEGFQQMRSEFQVLLGRPESQNLTHAFIAQYEQSRVMSVRPVAPGSHDPEEPLPVPHRFQEAALSALADTRRAGHKRGLVVLATGLGKTVLAALDAASTGARRVLFVAHREEILLQAERTFQRAFPDSTIGAYRAGRYDTRADMVFASIQTLGNVRHADSFPPQHFDYVVIDEFHHAQALTYRRLLAALRPGFLLGLTATPDRTDQTDILELCDGNLVYRADLCAGIDAGLLAPFTYYGIFDSTVDYDALPWRNGRFDPESLSNKLATVARADHALQQWRQHKQSRTLAFCASQRHADYMADYFARQGIAALSVHTDSPTTRDDALSRLQGGHVSIIFSVDLFNEGVDVPLIDTVMMLRPTESKILFLQQLGRGLRQVDGKDRLIILDFIGNHRGFFNKPQALLGLDSTTTALTRFAADYEADRLELPAGCFVNYDLAIIKFLRELRHGATLVDYQDLKGALGRRPTLLEFARSGASLSSMRSTYGSWWELLDKAGDLDEAMEAPCLRRHVAFFREIETTRLTKSFKAVLLESLIELDGIREARTDQELATQAIEIFKRRPHLINDLPPKLRDLDAPDISAWTTYWRRNPINAWTGGNLARPARVWFASANGRFQPNFALGEGESHVFCEMLSQVVEFHFAAYGNRGHATTAPPRRSTQVAIFEDLQIACGHFRSGSSEALSYRTIASKYARDLTPRHFIARARGDSMAGGATPIHDGDYLLLQSATSSLATVRDGATIIVECNAAGTLEYMVRNVRHEAPGATSLIAANPQYLPISADGRMSVAAEVKAVIAPIDLSIGQQFSRNEIADLFGVPFNVGNWNSGHVRLRNGQIHILLATLDKRGRTASERYHDAFNADQTAFYWQSQRQTKPESSRARELIEHKHRGIEVLLFARPQKLGSDGMAAKFTYYGHLEHVRHEGARPIRFTWRLSD